jgi:Multiubiquitin
MSVPVEKDDVQVVDKDHKTVTIIVNTRKHSVPKNHEISFEEVVALAFPAPPTGENVGFTVMYQRAEGNKDGTLVAGQTVKVKEGMIFDVTPTDRS